MLKTAHALVQDAKARIQEYSPANIKERISLPNVLILDVREADEFALGHLPNAINIPRGLLEFKISNDASLHDVNRPIVVYCKTSGRAALAAVTLQEMGFRNLASLSGGFDACTAENYPIDKPADISFD